MTALPDERAVSLAVCDDTGHFLIVKRPIDDDDEIAGVWGFPAIRCASGETEESAAQRVGTEKLGVAVRVGRRVGDMTHARRSYRLRMALYEATIVSGAPRVPQANRAITQYDACMFTADPKMLFEAARKGSQCTQIFLDDRRTNWRVDGDVPKLPNAHM